MIPGSSTAHRFERDAKGTFQIHDAELFAATVQENMTLEKLSQSDDEKGQDSIAMESVTLSEEGLQASPYRIQWLIEIGKAIAHANQCSFFMTVQSRRAFFIGKTADRANALKLLEYMVKLADQLAVDATAETMRLQQNICSESWAGRDIVSVVDQHWREALSGAFHQTFAAGLASNIIAGHRRALMFDEARNRQSHGLARLRHDEESSNEHLQGVFCDASAFPRPVSKDPSHAAGILGEDCLRERSLAGRLVKWIRMACGRLNLTGESSFLSETIADDAQSPLELTSAEATP